MTTCTICGEPLKPEQKVCEVCGTSVPTVSAPVSAASVPLPPPPVAAAPSSPAVAPPVAQAVGDPGDQQRVCNICQAEYGPSYQDEFCACGGELVPQDSVTTPSAAAPPPIPATPATLVVPPLPIPAPTDTAPGLQRPAAGTVCLVVYSANKEPIHYCAIQKDVTIIGRGDPVRGDFPDLDLGELFENAVSRTISRKHAMVLRSRTTGTYTLRPLGGNTGTQIEKELATQLVDYPLTSGTRLILGGNVRLKFEIIS